MDYLIPQKSTAILEANLQSLANGVVLTKAAADFQNEISKKGYDSKMRFCSIVVFAACVAWFLQRRLSLSEKIVTPTLAQGVDKVVETIFGFVILGGVFTHLYLKLQKDEDEKRGQSEYAKVEEIYNQTMEFFSTQTKALEGKKSVTRPQANAYDLAKKISQNKDLYEGAPSIVRDEDKNMIFLALANMQKKITAAQALRNACNIYMKAYSSIGPTD